MAQIYKIYDFLKSLGYIKNNKKLLVFTHGALLCVFSGVFLTVFVVNDELFDATRSGKIFFFSNWMIFFIPAGLYVFILSWKKPMDKLSILVLLWFLWIVVRGKTGGIWNDEKFFWFAGCFVFFFLAVSVLSNTIKSGKTELLIIPTLVITIVAASQAVIGLLQLYGGFRIYHNAFKITGTFFNPAPYACFLMASLPWALFITTRGKQGLLNQVIFWCGFLSVFLIAITLPATHSRAAWLGTLGAVLFWVLYRYKAILFLKHLLNTTIKKRLAYTLIPVLLILLFSGLYLYKKDSANGRLLIWKVAIETIKEKPIIGHGFNAAQATMAPAQTAYFAAGKGSEKEKMLAGSVRWAFNEPLQAASETGIPGMFLLMFVTGYALFFKIPEPFSRQNHLLIGASRSSLLGIVIFSCFSYPFYSLPVTLLFFYALVILASLKASTAETQNVISINSFKIPVLVIALTLGIFYSIKIPKLKQAYWLWDEAASFYHMNYYKEALESFEEALPQLKHNGLFLQQYSKSLATEGQHCEALSVLIEAKNYYCDEFSFIILGDVYKSIGNIQNAEEQYSLATNMVPHKFYPLYLLAKIYYETGKNEKAVAFAREILHKDVKVPSEAIEEMRKEMRELITISDLKNDGTEKHFILDNETSKKDSLMLIKHQFW